RTGRSPTRRRAASAARPWRARGTPPASRALRRSYALEPGEAVERAVVRLGWSAAKDGPLVLTLMAVVLDRPAQVRDAEGRCAAHCRKLHVVCEHDRPGPQQPAAVDEVEEDAFEAVVAVDEGEVEPPPFRKQPRQDQFGSLGVELDDVAHAGLLERAEACVDMAVRQPRVNCDVPRFGAVREQAFADEERGDGEPEPRLERP